MPNRAVIAELERLGLSLNKRHSLSDLNQAQKRLGKPVVEEKPQLQLEFAETVAETPVVAATVEPEAVVEEVAEPVVEAPAEVAEPVAETAPVVEPAVEEAAPVVEESKDSDEPTSNDKQSSSPKKKGGKK